MSFSKTFRVDSTEFLIFLVINMVHREQNYTCEAYPNYLTVKKLNKLI